MEDIIVKIQTDIKDKYYQDNYPNDGQRFIAWYLRNIHLLDQRQAKDAITDGANDKQIDAVFIDENEQKIHIIQGKFYTGDTVNAEPVREVISSWNRFDNLASLQEDANPKLKMKLSEISTALESDDDYCLCFELIASSTFTEEARNDINAFQEKLADNEDLNAEFVVVDRLGIADNYARVIEQCNPSLNHVMQLENGKYMLADISNTKVLMAAVPLRECIKIPGIKDGSLFQKNVRQSLGINNSVNKKIKKTIYGDKCNDFFFFHNGITAICNKMEKKDNDQICFYGLNVVNGCQSLTTILSCSEKVKTQDDSYVLFRFYEIPQRDRADAISVNTNTQSAVKARDLRSNDKRVLRLKKAYELKYTNGYFAIKRGEIIPSDKDKEYCIELADLGKQLTAWYMQRPNLSYGETKIFDKYFNTLFKNEYSPEDVYALNFWMNRIIEIWTDENPKSLNSDILTMKAYAPFHFLYAISAVFAIINKQSNVPSPSVCLKVCQEKNLVDAVISIVANCLNSAIMADASKIEEGKTFIPQNWVKNKSSIAAISSAVTNYFSFLPTMNVEMDKKMKELVVKSENFSYRVKADE